jgi:hypothetical protein
MLFDRKGIVADQRPDDAEGLLDVLDREIKADTDFHRW